MMKVAAAMVITTDILHVKYLRNYPLEHITRSAQSTHIMDTHNIRTPQHGRATGPRRTPILIFQHHSFSIAILGKRFVQNGTNKSLSRGADKEGPALQLIFKFAHILRFK
jgi:hypothetical protein